MKTEVNIASQCGATLGKFILVVERNNVDPNYSNKVTNNLVRPSLPFFLYSINPIQVTSVAIVETANNTKRIQFNNDPKLRLPLAGIDDFSAVIPKVNSTTVKDAIKKEELTGEKTIFIDWPALTKEIEALNTEQQSALSSFVTEQMKFVGTYKNANTKEILACKNAMNSIGVSVDF